MSWTSQRPTLPGCYWFKESLEGKRKTAIVWSWREELDLQPAVHKASLSLPEPIH